MTETEKKLSATKGGCGRGCREVQPEMVLPPVLADQRAQRRGRCRLCRAWRNRGKNLINQSLPAHGGCRQDRLPHAGAALRTQANFGVRSRANAFLSSLFPAFNERLKDPRESAAKSTVAPGTCRPRQGAGSPQQSRQRAGRNRWSRGRQVGAWRSGKLIPVWRLSESLRRASRNTFVLRTHRRRPPLTRRAPRHLH